MPTGARPGARPDTVTGRDLQTCPAHCLWQSNSRPLVLAFSAAPSDHCRRHWHHVGVRESGSAEAPPMRLWHAFHTLHATKATSTTPAAAPAAPPTIV
eukprot:2846642-Rhodomonas_salina.2